jgi:hypothetical protein
MVESPPQLCLDGRHTHEPERDQNLTTIQSVSDVLIGSTPLSLTHPPSPLPSKSAPPALARRQG